jgi:zinc protease
MRAATRLAVAALLVWMPAHAAPVGGAFQFTLPDGIRVVVLPDRHATSVTEAIWFRVGASDDPPGLSGMAHFMARLMFPDSKELGIDHESEMTAHADDAVSVTAHDYTYLVAQGPKGRLKATLSLLSAHMLGPGITDDNVTAAREAVLNDRALLETDASAVLDEQLEAALYLSHPYGRPVIGWPEEVKRIGRVDAADFYDGRYIPNNAILVVAGDVSKDVVRSDAESAFASAPAGTLVPRFEFAQAPREGQTRLTVASRLVKVAHFARIYRVVSYGDAAPGQAEALNVLAELLGGGSSSALYRTMVIEKKLASAVTVSYVGVSRDAGVFIIHAVARNGVTPDRLERATDDVVGRFANSEPKPGDLQRARQAVVIREAKRREVPALLALAYGEALAIGLTTHDVEAWPRRIEAVSGAEVMNAAKSQLTAPEAVTGYLVPGSAK